MKAFTVTIAFSAILGAVSATNTAVSQPAVGPQRRDGSQAKGAFLVKTFSTPYATYMVNATAGTPPQPFSLLVEPGSAYTWVPGSSVYYCGNEFVKGQYCRWGSCEYQIAGDQG